MACDLLLAGEVRLLGGNLDRANGLTREKKEYGGDRGGRLQVLSASSRCKLALHVLHA
jgi:hypothetical protein